MKLYKVELCLRLVLPRLRNYKLHEYNYENPIVFVQGSDPDDACARAFNNLIGIILKQDMSPNTISLIKEISNDIRIIKVSIPDDK